MDIAFIKQKQVAFGGGEGYLQGLMDRCAAQDIQVHLLTAKWSGEAAENLRVHPISCEKYSRKGRQTSFFKGVRACLEKQTFDAVLSLERTVGQDVWRGGEGVHRVWLNLRKQFDSPLKQWSVRMSAFQRTMLDLEEQCIRKTPYLIANSEMVKRDLLNTFPDLNPGKISVIYNGVDPHRFSVMGREENRARVRAELGMADTDKLLLLAGSGFARKGVAESIQVLRELSNCRLMIMGRDNSTPWKKLAQKAGVADRVQFFAPQNELKPFFHAADVALVPSWYDPFPNVGIEALACGVPVVTTRSTGTCDLIEEGANGSVFSIPSNQDGFAASVRRALGIVGGSKVAEVTREFTADRNAQETMDLLMKVASR